MATSIQLDPEIEQRPDLLAAQTGRTKAYYLLELITNGLDDLEDYYLAAATMERVRKGEVASGDTVQAPSRDKNVNKRLLIDKLYIQ
jgi:RHH-type transcriptional regulator, rel operon repressor / antitoxin RelB